MGIAVGEREYTSVRVERRSHDLFAALAAAEHTSLTQYLSGLAQQEWKRHVLAEFRRSEVEALKDPAYVAELAEWDAADDGIVYGDEGEAWWQE
jgi:hypothetical protein